MFITSRNLNVESYNYYYSTAGSVTVLDLVLFL